MDAHIQILNDKFGKDCHKVVHKFNPKLVNAYVGEFTEDVLMSINSNGNVHSIISNTETHMDHVEEISAANVSIYHNCIIVKCDCDQSRGPPSIPSFFPVSSGSRVVTNSKKVTWTGRV